MKNLLDHHLKRLTPEDRGRVIAESKKIIAGNRRARLRDAMDAGAEIRIEMPLPRDVANYDPDDAVPMNPAYIGSSLADFLAEEGILEEVRATSRNRVAAYQMAKNHGP